MRKRCIAVRSVTYAQKAVEVLQKYDIHGTVQRNPVRSADGCGWCVAVPFTQSETAYGLLLRNGVKVTGEFYDLS